MLYFTGVDDGDGFESAMRMLTDAAFIAARREGVRPGIVEQKEGAQLLAVRLIRKHRTNREAVAYPMLRRRGVDSCNLFHGFLLCIGI